MHTAGWLSPWSMSKTISSDLSSLCIAFHADQKPLSAQDLQEIHKPRHTPQPWLSFPQARHSDWSSPHPRSPVCKPSTDDVIFLQAETTWNKRNIYFIATWLFLNVTRHLQRPWTVRMLTSRSIDLRVATLCKLYWVANAARDHLRSREHVSLLRSKYLIQGHLSRPTVATTQIFTVGHHVHSFSNTVGWNHWVCPSSNR